MVKQAIWATGEVTLSVVVCKNAIPLSERSLPEAPNNPALCPLSYFASQLSDFFEAASPREGVRDQRWQALHRLKCHKHKEVEGQRQLDRYTPFLHPFIAVLIWTRDWYVSFPLLNCCDLVPGQKCPVVGGGNACGQIAAAAGHFWTTFSSVCWTIKQRSKWASSASFFPDAL